MDCTCRPSQDKLRKSVEVHEKAVKAMVERERFFCNLDPAHVPVPIAKDAAFLARPRTSDGVTLPTQALVATHAEPLPDIGASGIIVHSHHQTGRHQQHRRARGCALRLLASCKSLMQRFEPSSNFVLLF
jgi:hypothetical protein